MSDNPMYWPGHQRPAWHQQPPAGQPVNTMSHYATHPGNMLGAPMASDPSLQMQSSIPGRHQPPPPPQHQQHQSSLAPPPGAQSSLYPSMMSAPSQGSARPTTQLTSNSHLSAPPHASLQQPQHPQSHYPHQYSSLATSYWNPTPTGVPPPPPPTGPPTGQPQPTQSDGSSNYHSASASPLTNSSAAMQQTGQSSFHSPKDIQSSSDHMMSSYDRQRNSMTQQQQQHAPTMMSQNVPSSTASNLSPTQSQMSIQGRLQSQQSSAASNWSSSYYGQPTQSPYSSVMNPYGMPYGSSGTAAPPTHNSSVVQTSTRPVMVQKPSTNGSERARAAGAVAASVSAYPPHGTSSLYGQPPPPTGGSNGSYYGYDSYYNQASQASSDPYSAAAAAAAASQHWPSTAPSNQMISNSSGPTPIPMQPLLRPQTGTGGSTIHPQSPSASSSSLPSSLASRPQPPPSQTPDRSPAPQQHPQHNTSSYPSPNQQQGSSTKSASNSLAQLEQMVMPNSTAAATANKSPTQRSSTSSPSSAQHVQQQLQYSYNSSGQGSYFSTGANAAPTQSSYYSQQYDSSGVEMQKSGWPDQQPTGPVMMEGAQGPYGQSGGYDTSGAYGDYTSMQPRFSTPGDTATEPHSSDKGDPYAIDSQTFDDYDDQSSSSKAKKGRAKKGDEKVKKERKPRAPRAPKATGVQPMSPATSASLQPLQSKPPVPAIPGQPLPPPPPQPPTQALPQAPDMSSAPLSGTQSHMNSYATQTQQSGPTLKPPPSMAEESSILMSNRAATPTKSPAHRLSTDSPNPQSAMQQQQQLPYNSTGQSSYYSSTPSQPTYYPSYESAPVEPPKTWQDQEQPDLQQQQHQQPPPSQPAPQAAQTSVAASPSVQSLPTLPVQSLQQPPTQNTSMTSPIPPPITMDSTQAAATAYSQTNYENSGSYGDYIPLSTPSATQPGFSTTSDTTEASTTESNDTQTTSYPQAHDESFEQPGGSKAKKSRAKKGDEKVKRERKPRPPKGAKTGTQPSSPASTITPVQGLASNETTSTSPNHQLTSVLPDSGDVNNQSTKSPMHRLSTESPSSAMPIQPQYTYSGQSTYFTPGGTGQNQAGYYPTYETGQEHVPQATGGYGPPQPAAAEHSQVANEVPVYGQPPAYDSSYATYPPMTATTMEMQAPLVSGDDVQQQATEAGTHEDKAEASTSATKSKKSRAKKSEEKPKKERKPRAAKSAAQAAPIPVEKPPTPTPPPSQEEATIATEPQASQSTSESTPAEAKPKRIRIRDSSSKGKKKLPKFALKFAKTKKRKRLGSSDNDQSDLDKTPPPSPDEVESGVLKRRSARNTKKLKYNDDIALGFSDSDDESQILPKPKKSSSNNVTTDGDNSTIDDTVITDEPTMYAAPVEDTMVVEKIMATRTGKRELEPEPGEVLPPDGTHIEVEEFYVKYKNLSYLHCDWRTVEELEKGDRRVVQKIKRYKQKKDSSNLFSFMDEDLFDPQYCEVDRILAVNEVEEMVPDEEEEEKAEAVKVEGEQEKAEVPAIKSEESAATVETSEQDSDKAVEPEAKATTDGDELSPTITDSKPEEVDTTSMDTSTQDKSDTQTEQENKDEKPSSEIEKSSIPEEVKVDNDASMEDTQLTDGGKLKKMKKKISRHYLVKWRGLSYEDCTWELEEVLDPEKIKQFERFKDPPPKSKWKQAKRPKPEDWVRKEKSPVYKNNNTLREYQLEGINWLSFCWHQGRNCILADEMGLGKTIQSIAFVNEIYEHGINGPFLIIVPLSTVGNWAREFETWTDLNVITYHGSSTSREMLKEYEMFYRNEQDLREIPWKCCIIDEAHRLKNRNCKLLEGLRLLNMEHRVLLTGTPLQNNVEELFSLLNFLEPTQFSSTEQFLQEFGDLKTEAQVDKLKLILKPMMLRRLKEDVEKTLAPKEETIVEVELTNIQKKYYRAILEKNFSFLTKGSSSNNMPNLMNTMMELRKCCIHPYLINGAEDQIEYEARQAKLAGGEPMTPHQAMVNSSGKLVLIDKLLPRLRADGHRVLIFSQMVKCLDILEDYVLHKQYPFERIDGQVRGSDRQQAIDRFSKPGSDRFVFLLCTRAGGLGINLTAADTVIIFDSDWNPQNDLQAQARCHRIGQSKAVKIYRLICRNTYEREMFDKASLKLGLDKAVLQSMNTQKGGTGGIDGQLTKKEIEELLRKGAYGALMDDENAGDKFCEEDIDQILQRRTQVITIDNSEAKGSTFSKATFSSSNNREDIELDDPNFWEKWAKKANIDSDELLSKDELIQLAPRRRTQTKRYGADGNLIDISDLDSSEEDEETISMRTRGSRGRQPKLLPSSSSKRSKRHRMFEFEDDDFLSELEAGYWHKSDCLKVEKGLLTYGWGRWNEIISSARFKRDLTPEDCESICRVILLYCINNYKGDEKIKTFAWELITPPEESNKSQSDHDSSSSTRGRKQKSSPITSKKSIVEEMTDAKWTKEARNDPQLALPDDQYRRHLQRNCNRLLIRIKFLHYLKDEILKGFQERILADCNINEVDLPPVPVDGELPAVWWDDEADRSLLVGIFKHGHDKFSLMRQDPCLSFLAKCGPPNKEELLAEMSGADRTVDDLEDENREQQLKTRNAALKDSDAGIILDDLVENVARNLGDTQMESSDFIDENKNSILKNSSSQDSIGSCENGVGVESSQTLNKMDITDDESLTNEALAGATSKELVSSEEAINGEFLPFPSVNDLNQRFRRLITAYQRNSKKLEIKMAQKVRDELKKERTSKFEAAKNEREERKRFLAQKWSRREEADFFRAISSFGVEYDPLHKRHDWNKFRAIGKLDKKLDETLEEYYKAFIVMCKRVLSRPLTLDEEKCPINVDTITEDRAARCLARIEFLNKIRECIITHPELDERLRLCCPQAELPDWWENGTHDKDLLFAAAKHGLTRLDYNLAHDSSLSFDLLIRQRAEYMLTQPPTPILIPLEQLQELLEKNGIEYLKDLEPEDDSEGVRATLNSLLDIIELEQAANDGYKSFADCVDGPHSRHNDENLEKSLLATSRTPTKATRSSSGLLNLCNRITPNILSRRGINTIARVADLQSVCLNSLGHHTRADDQRVVEITPILPNALPDELNKTFEAGEISITVQSESALLKLDDREPIVLFGATNPVSIKIRWPKDKAIQTRLENLVYLVENNEWPSPPRPSIPTITLPNHLATVSTPLTVTTSPMKNDKLDMSLGSPKSDISNISSRTSRQDSKERSNDLSALSRAHRGRGRRPRPDHIDPTGMSHDLDSREDRQATAKLRNLLSQGPSSTTRNMGSVDKLTAKFGNNKQGAGLSSLLASFKQMRGDIGGSTSSSSRGRDDKNLLDLNSPATASLIPQILANMKPEFRDLLANQDAAQLLLNSLTGMTAGGIGANLRSSNPGQFSLDNLLNITKPAKGPPPAHQRTDNPPSAHGGGSSSRELRRNSQNARENSPPSINLRSNRGKGSLTGLDIISQQKSDLVKSGSSGGAASGSSSSSSKKRGRPSSNASDSPPGMPGADVLDLSSLPMGGKGDSPSRSELRSRRHRDQIDDMSSGSRSSVSTKGAVKTGSKQNQESEQQPSEKGGRTTRASKRIGSRIDALALNLQAKRLNRGDSPTSDLSPSLPKDLPMVAHGSGKGQGESKNQSNKAATSGNSGAPPAAHSGFHKTNSSGSSSDSKSLPANILPGQAGSSSSRQDPLAQLMSNPAASLLASLNPMAGLNSAGTAVGSSAGSGGDLMNQLLRKAGTNDIVKNLLNEFMKNPTLALDPNILATLSASMPMGTQGLAGFNLPTPPVTTMPPTSTKSTSSSLLNDFKSPSNNSLMKRSRQESTTLPSSRHTSGSSSGTSGSTALNAENRRSSSSTPETRHERRSSSSSSSGDRRSSSNYPDRQEKHSGNGKHEKRSSGSGQQESGSDASSRRSSSSLLAQQVPTSQQTSQAQTSSSTPIPSTLPNAASTLNLANQFSGLNSFSGLLNLPGMNELMKQMSNFPGLAGALPRVTGASVAANPTTTSNTSVPSNGDKGGSGSSRRSRQSTSTTAGQPTQTTTVSSQQQQQAANAALANIMNLAQPNATSNPYGSYANPLANPFLPFGLANLGMNNPLAGMGLFPNLYMPPGFPTPDQQQQQQQQPSNQSGGSADGGSKDKKMRYPRK